MPDKYIDTKTNVTPLPASGQQNYVIPFVKKGVEPPEGGNFTLEDMQKSAKENAAAIAKKADKSLLAKVTMTADSNVFQTTSNGYPLPEQVNHVHVDKGSLTEPVTIDGITVTNPIDFTVEPKDMAEKGIVLTNSLSTNTDDWTEGEANDIEDITKKLIVGRKYYARCIANIDSSVSDSELQSGIEVLTPAISTSLGNYPIGYTYYIIHSRGEFTASRLSVCKQYTDPMYYYKPFRRGGRIFQMKHAMLIDITELSAAYPQYSDEELKAILDDSLPYISAQQSKTLGGVCTLENLMLNPKNISGWNGTGNFSNLQKVGTVISATMNTSAGTDGTGLYPYAYASVKEHQHFVRVGKITSDQNYIISYNFGSLAENRNYGYGKSLFIPYENTLIVGALDKVPANITVDTAYGAELVDTTSPLLDLWLTLNDVRDKAAWCNENIPAFEGTYDLVLGMKDSLTITATCGAHTSSVTFKKAISQIKVSSLIESGDGFQKFADGTLKQWGEIKVGRATWESWGSLVLCTVESNQNFKLPFTKPPIMVVTSQTNPSEYSEYPAMILNAFATATTFKSFQLTRAAKPSDDTGIRINWSAIGHWK